MKVVTLIVRKNGSMVFRESGVWLEVGRWKSWLDNWCKVWMRSQETKRATKCPTYVHNSWDDCK